MALGTLADLEDQDPIPGRENPLKIHLKVQGTSSRNVHSAEVTIWKEFCEAPQGGSAAQSCCSSPGSRRLKKLCVSVPGV